MAKIEYNTIEFSEKLFSSAEYAEKKGYSSGECVCCQHLGRWCNGHNPLCPVSDNFMFG